MFGKSGGRGWGNGGCVIQPATPAIEPAILFLWLFLCFLTVYAVIIISYIYNNKQNSGCSGLAGYNPLSDKIHKKMMMMGHHDK